MSGQILVNTALRVLPSYSRNKKDAETFKRAVCKKFIRLTFLTASSETVRRSQTTKEHKVKGDCRHAPDTHKHTHTLDHAGFILCTKISAIKRWTSAGQLKPTLVPLDVQEHFRKSPKVKSTRRNGVSEQLPLQFGFSVPRFYFNIYNFCLI